MKNIIQIVVVMMMFGLHGSAFAQEGPNPGDPACDLIENPDCTLNGSDPAQKIPEPSVYMLLVAGLLGLGAVSYMKKRRKS